MGVEIEVQHAGRRRGDWAGSHAGGIGGRGQSRKILAKHRTHRAVTAGGLQHAEIALLAQAESGRLTLNMKMVELDLLLTEVFQEMSIPEIAEATGMAENAKAGKKGGRIAKRARLELERKTGKSVVTGENFLPQGQPGKRLKGNAT